MRTPDAGLDINLIPPHRPTASHGHVLALKKEDQSLGRLLTIKIKTK